MRDDDVAVSGSVRDRGEHPLRRRDRIRRRNRRDVGLLLVAMPGKDFLRSTRPISVAYRSRS